MHLRVNMIKITETTKNYDFKLNVKSVIDPSERKAKLCHLTVLTNLTFLLQNKWRSFSCHFVFSVDARC